MKNLSATENLGETAINLRKEKKIVIILAILPLLLQSKLFPIALLFDFQEALSPGKVGTSQQSGFQDLEEHFFLYNLLVSKDTLWETSKHMS